jgi:hypothetical protein
MDKKPEAIYYRGGPLDGTGATATARYSLIPDWEGSILCATEDGPRRCFTHHRYEKVTERLYTGEPYRDYPGYLESTYYKYVGREPAVPCGPIIGSDQPVFVDDKTPILNVPVPVA